MWQKINSFYQEDKFSQVMYQYAVLGYKICEYYYTLIFYMIYNLICFIFI